MGRKRKGECDEGRMKIEGRECEGARKAERNEVCLGKRKEE